MNPRENDKKESKPPTKRFLVVRLSSLGDLILSTSSLSALRKVYGSDLQVDWVVAREFASLLEGVPGVSRVIAFDRKAGLKAWFQLVRTFRARAHEYRSGLDLHRSLRSLLFRALTFDRLPWLRFSKERWRLEGFLAFRKLWPRAWRPRPVALRFAEVASGDGIGRPDLLHLRSEEVPDFLRGVIPSGCVAVAPGSLWPGKQWPVSLFIELVRELLKTQVPVMILGSAQDKAAREVVKGLKEGLEEFAARGVFFDLVGQLNLRQLGTVLSRARVLVGNDSGLSHYAEAVGVPSVTIYGPTSPEQGFGAWRPESRSVVSDLWCSPCSRGGERCFRLGENRFRCIQEVPVSQVMAAVLASLEKEVAL